MMRALVAVAVLPEYRRAFLDELGAAFRNTGDQIDLWAGDEHLDATVRSAPHSAVRLVRNVHLLGRRVLWQRGVFVGALGYDVLVVDLNPRSITAWSLLLARKLFPGRRTLVWGHILPRRGAGARTVPLRRFMRRLADGVISYTWGDAQIVRREDPGVPIWVAANGLYASNQLGWTASSRRSDLVYVGRLEQAKKPMLALEAFAIALDRVPHDTRLVFAGTGSEVERLQARARSLGLSQRVIFLGHVGDFDQLKALYATAALSLSPGYVGLSLTQSLGFGVPMVVADDEPHAPEVELLTPETGSLFAADDAGSLADQIVRQLDSPTTAEPDRLVRMVRERYSATAMARGFEAALRGESQGADDAK